MYLMKRPVSFKKLTALISRCFKRTPKNQPTPIDATTEEDDQIMLNHTDGLVPYDENLLECARTQWQFGDWESLIKIERETLQHHPDRAKLALLAAAGHLQQGDNNTARQFTRLAQDWGCSKKMISQILIAGVHNSLGRASLINGDSQRALQHFEFAISSGSPAGEVRLLTKARLGEQLGQLGQLGLAEDTLDVCLSIDNVGLRKDATQTTRLAHARMSQHYNQIGTPISPQSIIQTTNTYSMKTIHQDKFLKKKNNNKIIWFHVGPVKTGSTFIQYMLWKHRNYLSKHDICYFDYSEPKLHLPRYSNADFLMNDMSFDVDQEVYEKLFSVEYNEIIISEEGLWARIHVLNNKCFDGFTKKIIVYIRNPVEQVASWAAENALPYNGIQDCDAVGGYGVLDIELGIRLLTTDYINIFADFLKSIKNLYKTEVIYKNYDEIKFSDNDIFIDFIKTINKDIVDDPEFIEICKSNDDGLGKNISMSRKYCDVSSLIYFYLSNQGIRQYYSSEMVEFVYSKCKSGDERPVIETMSDDWIEKVAEDLRCVNDMLAEQYPEYKHIVGFQYPQIYRTSRASYIQIDCEEVYMLADQWMSNKG